MILISGVKCYIYQLLTDNLIVMTIIYLEFALQFLQENQKGDLLLGITRWGETFSRDIWSIYSHNNNSSTRRRATAVKSYSEGDAFKVTEIE